MDDERMMVGSDGFIGERLTELRAVRRIPSMTALARLLSVNSSTVSRWETGTTPPTQESLIALSEILRVRPEFFQRQVYRSERPLFFRKLTSTYARDISYQATQMHWLQELSDIVGNYVDYPEVDLPEVLGNVSYRQLRNEDIEKIAGDLREHWSLGIGPCPDMVGLLERIGCIVGAIELGTTKLDGVCSWSPIDQRPHILLSNDKMSFPRRQMDAAHELGHAVLHRGVSEDELKEDLKKIEEQAFRFASAFLLPADAYLFDMKEYSLARMLQVKGKWRVAVKAQIKRLSDLKVIDEDYARYLYKLYSSKGWAKGEPMDRQWPLTEPSTLRESLELIVDSNVRSKNDLLSFEFTQSAGDIENLASLPAGWLTSEVAQVVKLKPSLASSENAERETSGTVLEFPGYSK